MATYFSQPGQRMALDVDGTIMAVRKTDGSLGELSSSAKAIVQNESADVVVFTSSYTGSGAAVNDPFYVIFPEYRDITGLWFSAFEGHSQTGFNVGGARVPANIAVSFDTTNTQDGSFSGSLSASGCYSVGTYVDGTVTGDHLAHGQVAAGFTGTQAGYYIDASLATSSVWWSTYQFLPYYRTRIASPTGNISRVKALRFDITSYSGAGSAFSFGVQCLHIYGNKSSSQILEDKIEFWNIKKQLPLEMKDLDKGDINRSTSGDDIIAVKNISESSTANNIVISMEAQRDTSPTLVGQYLFSTDGENFYSTITIGPLSPRQQSENIWIRRITPTTAATGLWSPRITATVGEWT